MISGTPSASTIFLALPEVQQISLSAFTAATRDWPAQQIHLEYFTAHEPAALNGEFTVGLARSGRELRVPAEKRAMKSLS